MILIIEPHPDDAFLSMYHIIKRMLFEEKIYLYTVYTNSKRSSRQYCKGEGIHYVGQSPVEDVNMKQFHMNRSEMYRGDPWENQIQFYLDKHTESYCLVKKAIREIQVSLKPDAVITCLGLYHPFHVLVSQATQELFPSCGAYVDVPYSSRQYGQRILEACPWKQIMQLEVSEEEKKEKIRKFVEYFPTEKGMLKWDRDSIQNSRETLMKRSGFLRITKGKL